MDYTPDLKNDFANKEYAETKQRFKENKDYYELYEYFQSYISSQVSKGRRATKKRSPIIDADGFETV